MTAPTGCGDGPVAGVTPVDLARRVVDGLPVTVAAHQKIAAELVRLREAFDVAVERALTAALGEVRRQGGPDYLLREARSEGLAAASLALRQFRRRVGHYTHLVVIDREGATEARGFENYADAAEWHDSAGTQWSESYLTEVIKGPLT